MLPQLTDKQVCSHLPRSNHGNCLSLALPSLPPFYCLSDRAAWLAGCPGGKTIAGFKANVTAPPHPAFYNLSAKKRGKKCEEEKCLNGMSQGAETKQQAWYLVIFLLSSNTSTFFSPCVFISSSFCATQTIAFLFL